MVLQNSAYIDHVFLIDISHCLSLLDIFDLPVNDVNVIELDDGNILTGNPDQFDGKNPWVSH